MQYDGGVNIVVKGVAVTAAKGTIGAGYGVTCASVGIQPVHIGYDHCVVLGWVINKKLTDIVPVVERLEAAGEKRSEDRKTAARPRIISTL